MTYQSTLNIFPIAIPLVLQTVILGNLTLVFNGWGLNGKAWLIILRVSTVSTIGVQFQHFSIAWHCHYKGQHIKSQGISLSLMEKIYFNLMCRKLTNKKRYFIISLPNVTTNNPYAWFYLAHLCLDDREHIDVPLSTHVALRCFVYSGSHIHYSYKQQIMRSCYANYSGLLH